MSQYYHKYIKYKIKYNQLKNQESGGKTEITNDLKILEPKFINYTEEQARTEFDELTIWRYGPYSITNKNGGTDLYFFGYDSNTKWKTIIYIISLNKYKYDKSFFKMYMRTYNNTQYYIYTLGEHRSIPDKWINDIMEDVKLFMKIYKVNDIKSISDKETETEARILDIPFDNYLDKEELKDILIKAKKNNKFILYFTGAGISYDGIPLMSTIQKSISENYTTEQLLENPIVVIDKLKEWFELLRNTSPSKGHIALKNIIQRTYSNLITSNFDKLHQKSGIVPLHFAKNIEMIKDGINENKGKIYAIIGVGLSQDRGGIIEAIKESNPNVKVIFIDKFGPTNYIKRHGYNLVKDDLQILLPWLNIKI